MVWGKIILISKGRSGGKQCNVSEAWSWIFGCSFSTNHKKNCVYTVGNTIYMLMENNWHQGRSVGYLFSEQPIRIFPRILKNISPFGRFFSGLFLGLRCFKKNHFVLLTSNEELPWPMMKKTHRKLPPQLSLGQFFVYFLLFLWEHETALYGKIGFAFYIKMLKTNSKSIMILGHF